MAGHWAVLVVTLLVTLTAAWAQEPADPNQEAAQAPAAEPEEPAAAEAPPGREDSPFDYEASEQISEDLSVSFPVDI